MSARASQSPLRAVREVRPQQWAIALLMFGYFFFVITTFWVLKPIKKGLFIGYYDHQPLALFGLELGAAQAELIAKMLNVGVAFGAVVAFTWLSRHLHRE